MNINCIYQQDCLATLADIPSETVDLVITSPPYNKNAYAKPYGDDKSWRNLRGRQIAYDTYSDDMPAEAYAEWQKKVIAECLRVLKPSGSIFYNHKDILVNGLAIAPSYIYEFREHLHQTIVWNRKSTLANDPHYFQPITEWIYWLVKDPKGFYFNKQAAAHKQSVWAIPFEVNTAHPAPFPEKLVGNIILSCSKEGDLVFDPFMGSGTTAVVAARFKRNYIGSEISEQYVKMANKRIFNETSQLTLF